MPTKKNPTDATLRNVRAAKRREHALRRRIDAITTQLGRAEIVLGNHEARLRALESQPGRR